MNASSVQFLYLQQLTESARVGGLDFIFLHCTDEETEMKRYEMLTQVFPAQGCGREGLLNLGQDDRKKRNSLCANLRHADHNDLPS